MCLCAIPHDTGSALAPIHWLPGRQEQPLTPWSAGAADGVGAGRHGAVAAAQGAWVPQRRGGGGCSMRRAHSHRVGRPGVTGPCVAAFMQRESDLAERGGLQRVWARGAFAKVYLVWKQGGGGASGVGDQVNAWGLLLWKGGWGTLGRMCCGEAGAVGWL